MARRNFRLRLQILAEIYLQVMGSSKSHACCGSCKDLPLFSTIVKALLYEEQFLEHNHTLAPCMMPEGFVTLFL